ncbi:AAA family ATPase [Candidatus Woesearchaeota archaeon]|nr:AAA family ATPase [Candidatus Woesearchaeota archaeon]
MDEKIKRYIFDGASGSGKTVLLSGKSLQEPNAPVYDGFQNENGIVVFPESIPIVLSEIERAGGDPSDTNQRTVLRMIHKDLENYLSAVDPNSVYMFDRGLPFELLLKFNPYSRRKHPTARCFYNIVKHRYSNPVFVLEPIKSFDLSNSELIGRRYTLEERLTFHNFLKIYYRLIGYDVVEIPTFSDDIHESLRLRKDRIMEIIRS